VTTFKGHRVPRKEPKIGKKDIQNQRKELKIIEKTFKAEKLALNIQNNTQNLGKEPQ
jgi:hypothetical protein